MATTAAEVLRTYSIPTTQAPGRAAFTAEQAQALAEAHALAQAGRYAPAPSFATALAAAQAAYGFRGRP